MKKFLKMKRSLLHATMTTPPAKMRQQAAMIHLVVIQKHKNDTNGTTNDTMGERKQKRVQLLEQNKSVVSTLLILDWDFSMRMEGQPFHGPQ
jgi:hypothetical protein